MSKTTTNRILSQDPNGFLIVKPARIRSRRVSRFVPLMVLIAAGFTATAGAQQFFFVDCTGATPGEYTTINSALGAASATPLTVAAPTTYIVVIAGPCNETVSINNATNLDLGAVYGAAPVTLNGSVNVTGSNSVYLYGLNVTNPAGNGFTIASSHNVTLQNCSSNGNSGRGLQVGSLSDVSVDGPGSFDNNATGGINIFGNSVVDVVNWNGGTFDVSKNQGAGVWLSAGSVFESLGLTTIENNIDVSGSTLGNGFGITALGGSRVQIGTCFGDNVIQGNQAGGIDAEENTEVSLWNCGAPYQSFLTANGPVGISAGLGTQVTLYENAQISGHSGPGVELYGNSQLRVYGANLITQNGTAGDPRSAAIVVDGNSEAYLRGGTISGNQGPGILALVNSSADFTGATFSDNSGGVITCDSSAYMVSDLTPSMSNPGKGVACRTPHNLGNRHGSASHPMIPDFTAQKKKLAQYKAVATKKP